MPARQLQMRSVPVMRRRAGDVPAATGRARRGGPISAKADGVKSCARAGSSTGLTRGAEQGQLGQVIGGATSSNQYGRYGASSSAMREATSTGHDRYAVGPSADRHGPKRGGAAASSPRPPLSKSASVFQRCDSFIPE